MTRHHQPAAPAPHAEAHAEPAPSLEDLAVASATREVALPSGRAVEISTEGGAERLRVKGRGGRVELTVVLTDAGPKLVFESADVEIKSAGAVTVDCERFAVNARAEAAIRSEEVRVEATLGSVQVLANDAVTLDGEEVRMNCDKADDVPPWMRDRLMAQLTKDLPAAPATEVQGDASLVDEFEAKKPTGRGA